VRPTRSSRAWPVRRGDRSPCRSLTGR
jgi:hypothetical protein